ncbi:MAG: MFS transporter [Legionellales bacterium]|nr:MFS transporter [Legionellales bacterium]
MAIKKSPGVSLYVISILFTCFAFFQQTLPINASDHFQMDFGISAQSFVYVSSLFFISYALMQLPGGLLLDRYGIPSVLPLGIAFATLGVAIFWSSSQTWMIGFGRILTGLGCSIAYISGIYVSSSFFSKARLTLLICFLECSATIGGLIAARPLQLAISTLGWTTVGSINIALCMLLLVWSYLSTKTMEKTNKKNQPNMTQLLQGIIRILRNKTMLLIFGYSFCTWFVMMSFPGYWFKDYLKAVHQYSTITSLALVETYWSSFLMACLGVGVFSRYFKRPKVILLLLSGTAFLTYLAMAQPYLFSYWGLTLFSIFGGISASGIIIAFSLIPSLIESNYHGTGVAINNTFVVLGGYAGQTLFGVLVNKMDISRYLNILEGSHIEPYHYSALLIYLLFTLFALIFAILIRQTKTM